MFRAGLGWTGQRSVWALAARRHGEARDTRQDVSVGVGIGRDAFE